MTCFSNFAARIDDKKDTMEGRHFYNKNRKTGRKRKEIKLLLSAPGLPLFSDGYITNSPSLHRKLTPETET